MVYYFGLLGFPGNVISMANMVIIMATVIRVVRIT